MNIRIIDASKSGQALRDAREALGSLKKRLSVLGDVAAAGNDAKSGGVSPQESVRKIIEDVRANGDEALLRITERFDKARLTAAQLRVGPEEIAAARRAVPKELVKAIKKAAANVRRFQKHILPKPAAPLDCDGYTLKQVYAPVRSAGIYVPGGTASLFSSVLMNVIPANVAGVERIVLCTPPRPDGSVSPDRLVAAEEAGVKEIYRLGGAQAIAAMAFGTATVPAVDMIAGPGNLYVMLAKKEVFGHVGIDSLAGPSEIAIVADSSSDPECLAADMISQAEHAPGSAVLFCCDAAVVNAARERIESQLSDLPKAADARDCLERFSLMIVTRDTKQSIELADEMAPEHIEIQTKNARKDSWLVRNAGAVFVGRFTPVATGDYIAGPSHVLPTGGTARFFSGLSCAAFLRQRAVIMYEKDGLAKAAGDIVEMARAEGLEGHARSVLKRLDR
ncbi:MAG TPA: histidinol dehydrogenase [Candidatus Brocadiia bacterium]|nr:histidinol dehydrogenase [Candidatus Brocadiia bacterium]